MRQFDATSRARCRWQWRLGRLLARLFIIVAVCFGFSTRRRRLLAMPVRRWIRDKAQQLVVAGGALAVNGAGVGRSYSCGSSSSPLAALCCRLRLKRLLVRLLVVAVACFVFSTPQRRDCWQCRYAARDVTRLDGSLLQTMLLPSMTGALAEATLWLVIVAVGRFMFTARRLLKLLV